MRILLFSLFALSFIGSHPLLAQEEKKEQETSTSTKSDDFMKSVLGTWEGSAEKTQEFNGEDAPEGMIEEVGNMFLEFLSDGTLKSNSRDEKIEGEFKFEASEEKGIFNFTFSGGNLPGDLSGTIKLEDKNTLHITPDNGPGLTAVFTRKRMTADEATKALVGKWEVDSEKTLAKAKEMGTPDDMLKQIETAMEGFKLEMKDDASYVLDNFMGKSEGTWKVVADEESGDLNMIADSPDGELNFSITFNGKDSVTMQPSPEEPPVVFVRSK